MGQAFIVDRQLRPILLGEDPLAIERIWDKLYRSSIHGRKGTTMMAISAVDCALLMDACAANVLQPDIYWAGGISEVLKICALASTYDLPVIPHGYSVPATVHLIASQPSNVCPLLEYLVKWNQVHQFFFKEPVQPRDGQVMLTEGPGMGVEIDESKVSGRRDIRWG